VTDAPTEGEATEPPTGVDEAEGTRRTPALVLAVTLTVVFGVAAIALGLLLAGDDDGDSRVGALRRAAGEVGQALLTYDFEDPEAHRDAVLALATGSFRSEYEEAFEQGLGDLISEVQATSEGFVKDVYVSEIDDERAEAIVVTDVTRDGPGGPRTLFDIYVLLTFVEVDGDWKVDQVTDLNFEAEGSPEGSGGDATGNTTSSSVPVP
jgi:hypothetical protein